MPTVSDQTYLLTDQYKDAAKLDARVQLHLLYSTNKYGWHQWCFDQYTLPAQATVLELGCGPAYLWKTNLDRLPVGWRVTLSDFSAGMLEQAKRNLDLQPPASTTPRSAHAVSQPKAGRRARRHAQQFVFEIVDAQAIPFEAHTFDAVIANHMLYHVPDRAQALSEMRRVLKPGGKVYLVTNGLTHLRELYELQRRFDSAVDFGWSHQAHETFSLDTGGVEVAQFFADVHIVRYEDELNVTAAEPLVNYILSMTTTEMKNRREELRQFIEHELAEHSVIHIRKESGMFIGTKAA
jgi:ubiquinone/menaquinone biosynthesis C-methylase UbiE